MAKCLVCEKEIGKNERAVWFLNATAICKICEFERITVFHVTLHGEQAGGYYEEDKDKIDSDTDYMIIEEKMAAIKYYSLPEFAGF